MYSLLLAVFKIQVCRLKEVSDIVIGCPVANRGYVGVGRTVGPLANVVPLRTEIHAGDSIEEVLEAVWQTCTESFEHQDVSFEEMLRASRLKRVSGAHPCFQMMFELELEQGRPDLPGLEVSVIAVRRSAAMFDLTMTIADTGDGLNGLSYCQKLWIWRDRATKAIDGIKGESVSSG